MSDGPKRVLVVDDDGAMRALIAALLRKEGDLEVDTVETGTAALDHAGKTGYGVIVLDMMLPDMSGLQFIEKLRVVREEIAPIIAITGASSTITPDEVIHGSFAGGVYEIIRKPLDQKRLVAAVRECVDQPL